MRKKTPVHLCATGAQLAESTISIFSSRFFWEESGQACNRPAQPNKL